MTKTIIIRVLHKDSLSGTQYQILSDLKNVRFFTECDAKDALNQLLEKNGTESTITPDKIDYDDFKFSKGGSMPCDISRNEYKNEQIPGIIVF